MKGNPKSKSWLPFFFVSVLVMQLPWQIQAFAGSPDFHVIAHPKSSIAEIDRKLLSNLFLKKTKFFEDGQVAVPVDLTENSAVRDSFSNEVLGRSVRAVKSYWQQMIFSGREVPPVELTSDKAVLEYIKSHENSIGYVSDSTVVRGVKVISIR